MKIKLSIGQSDYLTSSYISELTNHAKVNLEEIIYDPEKELAEIQLTRYQVVDGKNLLGLGEYQRDYDSPIKSKAIIKNIERADIKKAAQCDDIKEITLIFGITFKRNEIYLGSAEEATGQHCFDASFFGDKLIIEIEDK